ncbi:MAG: autotransporter outer membrane beta-barrel domain-containing protein [Methylobacteriaceae bacterium]|nr:autotransporter outer membrane beta-barrel domain-containing protein [Methylobacteriaceae bacterium]
MPLFALSALVFSSSFVPARAEIYNEPVIAPLGNSQRITDDDFIMVSEPYGIIADGIGNDIIVEHVDWGTGLVVWGTPWAKNGGVIDLGSNVTVIVGTAGTTPGMRADSGGRIIADNLSMLSDPTGLYADGAGTSITLTGTTLILAAADWTATAIEARAGACVTVTGADSSIMAASMYPLGIHAMGDGTSVTVSGATITVDSGAGSGYGAGIFVPDGAASVTLMDSTLIVDGPSQALAVDAWAGSTVTIVNSEILVLPDMLYPDADYPDNFNIGFYLSGAGTTVTMSGSTMTVQGPENYGLYAVETGSGSTLVLEDSHIKSSVSYIQRGGYMDVTLTYTTLESTEDYAFKIRKSSVSNTYADIKAHGATFNGIATTDVGARFDLTMTDGSEWDLTGDSNLTNLINDNSHIVFAPHEGGRFTTLTIDGNYRGDAGHFYINTQLGDDASPTDLIHIRGDSSGTSYLHVTNAGGEGALTTGDGIPVVLVDGASDGTFILEGDYRTVDGYDAIVVGAYGYTLWQNGVTDPEDGDWYLRSQTPAPEAGRGRLGGSREVTDDETGESSTGGNGEDDKTTPTTTTTTTLATALGAAGGVRTASRAQTQAATILYQPYAPLMEAYPRALLEVLSDFDTYKQRVGGRYEGSAELTGRPPVYAFAMLKGERMETTPHRSTTGASSRTTNRRIVSGFDVQLADTGAYSVFAGLNAIFGRSDTRVSSRFGNGSVSTEYAGVGATLTWLNNSGTYIDLQGKALWMKSDLSSDLLGNLTGSHHVFGYAVSIEAGHEFRLNSEWSLTPQAQLIYGSLDMDEFSDRFGNRYSAGNSDSLRGRVGLAAEYRKTSRNAKGETAQTKIYGIVNLYGDFDGRTTMKLAGTNLHAESERISAGIGAGVSHSWKNGKYRIFGEVSGRTGLRTFGKSYAVAGRIGFVVRL